MIGTVQKFKALRHWLLSCVTEEQVDVLVNCSYTILVEHDGALHEFDLIKADAEAVRENIRMVDEVGRQVEISQGKVS